MKPKEYAMYKGDMILSIGTLDELSKNLGILKNTLYHYKSPAYQRKLATRKNLDNCRILIEIDENEDDEDFELIDVESESVVSHL